MKSRGVLMVVILIVVGAAAAAVGLSASGSGDSNGSKAKVLGNRITPSTTEGGSTSTAGVSSTTSAPSTSTTGSSTTSSSVSTSTTVKPAATAPSTTTSTIACRNSYNPQCGRFYWSPAAAPADHTVMTFSFSPNPPKAGDNVKFTIHVSEPNTVVGACSRVEFGDGIGVDCQQTTPSASSCPTRYGPWTPPAKSPHEADDGFTHRYDKPGNYTVTVSHPLGTHCYDPWEGTAAGSWTITVK